MSSRYCGSCSRLLWAHASKSRAVTRYDGYGAPKRSSSSAHARVAVTSRRRARVTATICTAIASENPWPQARAIASASSARASAASGRPAAHRPHAPAVWQVTRGT
jgi:hypothetical protein